MRYLIVILFFFLNQAYGGDAVAATDDDKIDLMKVVKLRVYNGVPGTVSQNGDVFTSVHGYRVMLQNPYEGARAGLATTPVDLPFWLSRRPSAKVKAQMNAEQQAFWDAVGAEAAIATPLLNKQADLQLALWAKKNAGKEHSASVQRAHQKNSDPSAATLNAWQRQATSLAVAITDASTALKTWEQSSDGQTAVESAARLRALWAPKMPALTAVVGQP